MLLFITFINIVFFYVQNKTTLPLKQLFLLAGAVPIITRNLLIWKHLPKWNHCKHKGKPLIEIRTLNGKREIQYQALSKQEPVTNWGNVINRGKSHQGTTGITAASGQPCWLHLQVIGNLLFYQYQHVYQNQYQCKEKY